MIETKSHFFKLLNTREKREKQISNFYHKKNMLSLVLLFCLKIDPYMHCLQLQLLDCYYLESRTECSMLNKNMYYFDVWFFKVCTYIL